MSTTPLITLTSDFGAGSFPGLMKGVILQICPQARLVDVSHAVPPQDILAGTLIIEDMLEVFRAPTVHLAVVDPGVGTARRPLVVLSRGMCWVGPDNGLFTPVFRADSGAQARLIAESGLLRHPVSGTFHGRDVFAPAAAHLAAGFPLDRVGPLVDDPVLLDLPLPRLWEDRLEGQVLGTDPFGNLTTNLRRNEVSAFLGERGGLVRLSGPGESLGPLPLISAYGEAGPGRPLALWDSAGRLELALNRGSLADRLCLSKKAARGLDVWVHPADARP